MKKKRVNGSRKMLIRLYGVYVIGIAVAVVILGFIWIYTEPIKAKFEPEEKFDTAEEDGLLGISYNYYLDFSPSMEGFFTDGQNSTMYKLDNALKNINVDNQNLSFYQCTDQIQKLQSADYFYANMESETNIRYLYDMTVNDGIIGDVLDDLNLSKIFNSRYSDGNIFQGGNTNVNVIISDMNFRNSREDTESYSELINEFAEQLGIQSRVANIGIYNLYSEFNGNISDEYNMESGTEIGVERDMYHGSRPFFLIIISENQEAYSTYIQRLETEFGLQQIDYSQKFELINDMAGVRESRLVDYDYYQRMDMIQKQGLNYDRESFIGLKENETAFQIVNSAGNSELTIPVAEVKIPGYYDGQEGENVVSGYDNTVVDVIGEVYYPSNTMWNNAEYAEYTEEEIITYQSAGILWQGQAMYLQTSLRLDNKIDISAISNYWRRGLRRPYIVVYLQLYLNTPDYVLPGWVSEIQCEEITTEPKMLNIDKVFSNIIEQKKRSYAKKDLRERYLGDAVIYLTY